MVFTTGRFVLSLALPFVLVFCQSCFALWSFLAIFFFLHALYFVLFLFLLVSGAGCDLCLWHSHFLLTFLFSNKRTTHRNEPPHDKTQKVAVRPAKTKISLGIRPVRSEWALSYPVSAKRRLWSEWADAQADLSLRWAHSHFVGFVTRRLK